MSKKKTVSETAGSKTTAKKSAKRASRETNAADVRKKVSKMVKAKAVKLAEAVIGKTEDEVPEDLQLATVKYMFEMAEIYPPQANQDAASADEDCLAKTLLNRLNIPDVPIRRDEDEEEEVPLEKGSAAGPEEKDSAAKEKAEGGESAHD